MPYAGSSLAFFNGELYILTAWLLLLTDAGVVCVQVLLTFTDTAVSCASAVGRERAHCATLVLP